ncbi:transposase [Photobacterium leiognathi]|uniref:transposase n=1 Tax=Photobacterium leiognathi TaxID=553611 RepID=UPI002981B185|nr:transposase [Photobacterium leiognathi]
MTIELNSVWRLHNVDGFEDGLYRVLSFYPDEGLLIIFKLLDKGKLQKPAVINLSLFSQLVEKKQILSDSYPVPFYQLAADDEIPESHKNKRDLRYKQIKDLVNTSNFLLELACNSRSRLVSYHAKKQGIYIQSLHRALNLYWKYGQNISALIPAYKNSGGLGKSRLAGNKKRGSPIQMLTPSIEAPIGVNTNENDKFIFIKAMKRFGAKGKQVTFSKVYNLMLKEFYAEELISADTERREAKIPTYRAFIYWVNKLIPKQELIKKQTTPGYFDRNYRGLNGAATDHTEVPGSCFELDATVLDVHVVSEFRRNHVLGRPTVYCVIDKESRMIVGLHVSMEYASWRAGRQALINSFTSKKDYCDQYDITIEENEWPCHHIPQRLLCDRGEFICKEAENLAVPLIGHLSIASPYRADMKGTIEQRFNILNEKLVHDLVGTTRGRQYIRGDRDPRLDAALTLKEINGLLIDAILEHNSSVFEDLAGQTSLLIESDLSPTPINYWNIHMQKHRHALSRTDEAQMRVMLLPKEWVSMTSKGIRLNDDMYYESEHPEYNDWKVIARTNGHWRLEARIDQDNSSFIYVQLKHDEPFYRCYLRQASNNFKNKHQADILFFEDWKKLKKKQAAPTEKSIERHQRRNKIIQHAKDELAAAEPLTSKAEKIKGIKERRKKAILESRFSPDNLESLDESQNLPVNDKEKKEKVTAMLRKKKRGKK